MNGINLNTKKKRKGNYGFKQMIFLSFSISCLFFSAWISMFQHKIKEEKNLSSVKFFFYLFCHSFLFPFSNCVRVISLQEIKFSIFMSIFLSEPCKKFSKNLCRALISACSSEGSRLNILVWMTKWQNKWILIFVCNASILKLKLKIWIFENRYKFEFLNTAINLNFWKPL